MALIPTDVWKLICEYNKIEPIYRHQTGFVIIKHITEITFDGLYISISLIGKEKPLHLRFDSVKEREYVYNNLLSHFIEIESKV
jgi:hypothetical protein